MKCHVWWCCCLNGLLVYCFSLQNTLKVPGDLCNVKSLLLSVLHFPISFKLRMYLCTTSGQKNWTWCVMRFCLNIQNTFCVIPTLTLSLSLFWNCCPRSSMDLRNRLQPTFSVILYVLMIRNVYRFHLREVCGFNNWSV